MIDAWKILLRTMLPAQLFGALVFSLLAILLWTAVQHEERLIHDQSELVLGGVLLTQEPALGKLARDYAYWSDAMEHLLVALDIDWAVENFGDDLIDTFGLSASLVLDSHGQLLFARAPKGVDSPEIEDIQPSLDILLSQASVNAGGTPVVVTGYGLLRGKLQLLAAARFVPNLDRDRYAGVSGYFVVSKPLDATLLKEVEARFGLVDLTLKSGAAGRLALQDFQGGPFYAFDWTDRVSASRLATDLAPWAYGSAGLVMLAVVAATWRMYRLAVCYERLSRSLEDRVAIRTRDLEAAKARAESANHAKSRFLSSMSHELRTPLHSIMGFAQVMELDSECPLTTEQRESLAVIESSGRHLLDLISNMLDLAVIESGQIPMNTETVDSRRLIDEVLAMARPTMDGYGIALRDDTDPRPLPIRTDFRRAKQALLSLLSNAAKYNRKDGSAWVETEVLGNGMLRVAVNDSGQGMTKEQQQSLFEPFNRLGRESLAIEGVGIGLCLTRRIIEAMDATIGFQSVSGKGSRFWIDFPCASADAEGA